MNFAARDEDSHVTEGSGLAGMLEVLVAWRREGCLGRSK